MASAFLLAADSWGEDWRPTPLSSRPKEVVKQQIPISGHQIVGLLHSDLWATTPAALIAKGAMRAQLSAGFQTVCITYASADGRYEASWSHSLKGMPSSGAYPLAVGIGSEQTRPYLSSLGSRSLAILAVLSPAEGGCNDYSTENDVLAPLGDSGPLVLLVNAGGADAVILTMAQGKFTISSKCASVVGGSSHVSFDRVCQLPTSADAGPFYLRLSSFGSLIWLQRLRIAGFSN